MKAESLIFDVDGTLWDSVALVAKGWNIALEAVGLEPRCTEDNIRPLFGKTMDEIAQALFPEVQEGELRHRLMAQCMASEDRTIAQDKGDIFYPGVAETLHALAKTHRLFIVSNCQRGYIEILLEKGKLAGLITDHSCFGVTGTPKGQTIRAVMERNGITSALYVGDTQGDLEAAELAGIPFVWASYGFGTPSHYDAQIRSFPDLLTLMNP